MGMGASGLASHSHLIPAITESSSFPSIYQPFNWTSSLNNRSLKAFPFCFYQILRLFESGSLSSWFGELHNIIRHFYCGGSFQNKCFHYTIWRGLPLSFVSLRGKKKLPRENSFFFLQSSLIETIGSIDTLQVFQIFVTLVKVSIVFPLKEILHY